MSTDIALKNSKENIIKFITSTSSLKKAKLMLETPSGQGTELLTDIEDFYNFCKDIFTSFNRN